MKKYYLLVLGCQMNYSDSEKIIALLKKAGFESSRPAEADIIVVIACSVRQKPIDRIWGSLKQWKKVNPDAKLYLTGCLTDQDQKKFQDRFDFIFEIEDLDKFSHKLGLESEKGDYLSWKGQRKSNQEALIPIMTGCNNFCSYCVVPYTRGRERSRPVAEILTEFNQALKNGYLEIMLLGQNVNSYSNNNLDFVGLLKEILKNKEDFELKFMTSHPKDLSDELVDLIAFSPRISREIHLPVQSGSNRILKKMNRKYTREKYLELVEKMRKKIPDLVLTTDIIVGFPTETEADFKHTIDLAKKASFSKAYLSQYSVRPGTQAEKMEDDVSVQEKKKRWLILEKLINS